MYCTERVVIGLKKSAKYKESQWHAESAHCAHTGHDKGKCLFCGCFQGGTSIYNFVPRGQGNALKGS